MSLSVWYPLEIEIILSLCCAHRLTLWSNFKQVIENLHAHVHVGWKILHAPRKKYMHLCKCACLKLSTVCHLILTWLIRPSNVRFGLHPNVYDNHGFDSCTWLKLSMVVASLMLLGRWFHSTMVLGRKEYLKQSFLEVRCPEDDLCVEIPPSDLVWNWSVSIATWWTASTVPIPRSFFFFPHPTV